MPTDDNTQNPQATDTTTQVPPVVGTGTPPAVTPMGEEPADTGTQTPAPTYTPPTTTEIPPVEPKPVEEKPEEPTGTPGAGVPPTVPPTV